MPHAGASTLRGIDYGEAMVGSFGWEGLQTCTALGHTVNLPARLCSAARGWELLISRRMFETLRRELREKGENPFGDQLSFSRVDVQLKGVRDHAVDRQATTRDGAGAQLDAPVIFLCVAAVRKERR